MRAWITSINETLEKYRKSGFGTNAIGSDTKEIKPATESNEQEPIQKLAKKPKEISQDDIRRRLTVNYKNPTPFLPGQRKSMMTPELLKKPSIDSFSDDEESDDEDESPEMRMSDEVKSKVC